jgi:hypothetical protein
MKIKLEDVFVTEGVPEFTFVKPPNYNRILLDVRSPGKPIVLEGQSGTGKTTCIKRILNDMADQFPTVYLAAREPVDVSSIEHIARDRPIGRFVIDDFHRLSANLQEILADIAKVAAESSDRNACTKLILVGINNVGSNLIQLVPDIAKRVGIHTIEPGGEKEIRDLVERGARKLNITIADIHAIFEEVRGDYWLTQQFCQSICLEAGVMEARDGLIEVGFDVMNVRRDVVQNLKNAHYPAVKEFCRGKRFRPSNQPYFKVLRAIAQRGVSNVDLNELANSDPEVRGSINNIKERRLAILLESKPLAARSFYYNKETKNFSVDDPALFYFLRHLDWDALRQDCGYKEVAENYEYDIALSFAGETRELAKHIAMQLEDHDVRVFYDEFFEVNFLGKALTKKFNKIFTHESRFVVVLLDKNHAEKLWPTFEREHFTHRVADEHVIPIFLDDTKFVGIPADIFGVKFKFDPNDPEWRIRANSEIIDKLIEKITL